MLGTVVVVERGGVHRGLGCLVEYGKNKKRLRRKSLKEGQFGRIFFPLRAKIQVLELRRGRRAKPEKVFKADVIEHKIYFLNSNSMILFPIFQGLQ